MVRKLLVWLVCFAAVVGIYLLYLRLAKTPEIATSTGGMAGPVADFNDEVGKLGKVGVGTIRNAEFVTLDPKIKGVEKIVFGFEELLHAQGNEWDVTKPYFHFFMSRLKCSVTAEKGKVRVESLGDRYNPTGGQLADNVIVRTVPYRSGDITESTMYLDDISFAGEKAQFLTDGPVKLVSKDATMLGRGLELVYNDRLSRIEYLRIKHLRSLHLNNAEQSLFAQQRPRSPAENSKAPQFDTARANQQTQRRYYRCTFSKNVLVDAPRQMAFAADSLCINDILFSRSTAESAGSNAKDANSAGDRIAPTRPSQSEEIIVTCDNGILFAPVDSNRTIGDFTEPAYVPDDVNSSILQRIQADKRPTRLIAQKIDHFVGTQNTVATGPLELVFHPNDVLDFEPNDTPKTPVPVKITARKKAEFLSGANRAIFEGGVLCTMVRRDPNITRDYRLGASTLTIDLSQTGPDPNTDAAVEFEHLTAAGGTVRLSVVTTAKEKVLSGIELKCAKFDYDAGDQTCLATGPGMVTVRDSRAGQPNAPPGSLNFEDPYWALVRDFATLQFYLAEDRILADAAPGQVLDISYVPIIKGQYGQIAKATAARIEALLYQTGDRRTDVAVVNAEGAVTYNAGDTDFAGSRLLYNRTTSVINIAGDESQPCLLNGVPVDRIEYNLETGRVSAEVLGPGAM